MNQEILKEAKRLHDLGMAVHWLHEKSKRPIESGWTKGPRASWENLKKSYKKNLNVGVRLGEASKIAGHFLGIIDVDIKSPEERHAKEATRLVEELTQGHSLPEVISGRGNGSRHYYILSKTPLKPFTLRKSSDMVKVSMPSAGNPSQRELKELTKEEIAKGIRIRPAWEIGIMGEGQQVVLPPSVHPDSGRPYKWSNGGFKIEKAQAQLKLPAKEELKPLLLKPLLSNTLGEAAGAQTAKAVSDLTFELATVDLGWLPGVSDKIKDMILKGTNVTDRSAMLLPIAKALFGAGLSRNEILSVLTDPNTFIGACAYDHAKTSDRNRAARWVWNFTLKKVEEEMRDAPIEMFSAPIEKAKPMTAEEIEAEQNFFDKTNWRNQLDMTDKGYYRGTLKNCILIFKNVMGAGLIKRDTFSFRDFYGEQCPWGKKGSVVADDDSIAAKYWIAQHFGMEPTRQTIEDAFIHIAVENSFDPVLEELKALPPWDEVERLDTWLSKHFNATGNAEYLAQVFRKWICGMVLRIQKPGAHFPWMPIFEGNQGVGKSSFGRILVGEQYFLDWLPDLADKDAALALQGRWAIEMGELASLRKNEIETVKAFVSRRVDKVRPPYGRRVMEVPRRSVFFGTTNSTSYLQDDSGNRRFKPVMVGKLDFQELESDRNQLFAEAVWLIENGFESEHTMEFTGDAKTYELKIQRDKMVKTDTDLMADILTDFLHTEWDRKEESFFTFDGFKISDLFGVNIVKGVNSSPLKNWQFTPRNVRFAGTALSLVGAAKHHTRKGNAWKWRPVNG